MHNPVIICRLTELTITLEAEEALAAAVGIAAEVVSAAAEVGASTDEIRGTAEVIDITEVTIIGVRTVVVNGSTGGGEEKIVTAVDDEVELAAAALSRAPVPQGIADSSGYRSNLDQSIN
jgi:hypothetical protein